MNNQNQEMKVPSFLKNENKNLISYESNLKDYENSRMISSQRIYEKKSNLKKKLVKTTFVAGATLSLAMLAPNGYKQFVGSERIANEFYTYTRDYGINNTSNVYLAFTGGKQISLDSAMEDIVNDARYGGMSDAEISIGMSKVYNSDFALKYVGEVSNEEKANAKYNAYGEYQLERNEKKTGGMSK